MTPISDTLVQKPSEIAILALSENSPCTKPSENHYFGTFRKSTRAKTSILDDFDADFWCTRAKTLILSILALFWKRDRAFSPKSEVFCTDVHITFLDVFLHFFSPWKEIFGLFGNFCSGPEIREFFFTDGEFHPNKYPIQDVPAQNAGFRAPTGWRAPSSDGPSPARSCRLRLRRLARQGRSVC